MAKEYLDELVIDGLDETHAANANVDDVAYPTMLLVDFIIDGSGSMWDFDAVMRDCLQHYKTSICNSKQADEMLVSKTIFNEQVTHARYSL